MESHATRTVVYSLSVSMVSVLPPHRVDVEQSSCPSGDPQEIARGPEKSLAETFLMFWPSIPLPHSVSSVQGWWLRGNLELVFHVVQPFLVPQRRSILPRTPHNLQALQVQVVGRLHLSFSPTCLHRAMAPPFLWTVRNVDNLSVAASI